MERKANINRKTKETDINLELNIDGKGESNISSGVGFLDHMLESFAKHGLFDLNDFVLMSFIPAISNTALTGPPAITPVP